MNALLTAVSAAGPLACGWGVHGLLLGRRLTAARRDPLSGLWTRAAFERAALRILGSQMHTAVVLVDLDGFKALNDRFGHAAGDAAIRATAASLTDAVSSYPGAVVGRLGGDEFVAAGRPARRDHLPVPFRGHRPVGRCLYRCLALQRPSPRCPSGGSGGVVAADAACG